MLALGVRQKAVTGPKAKQYATLAKDLTYTCYKMYALQPTGMAASYAAGLLGIAAEASS